MVKKKYIAKPNTWFKEGTEVQLVDDCGEMGGVFCGIRIAQNETEYSDGRRAKDDEYEDEELCPWDEFWTVILLDAEDEDKI